MKKSNKFLLLCFSICLILAFCATGISAANNYEPVTYANLVNALSQANDGDIVTVGTLTDVYTLDPANPILYVKPGVTLRFTEDITLPDNLLISFSTEGDNSARLIIDNDKTVISTATWDIKGLPPGYEGLRPGFDFGPDFVFEIAGEFTAFDVKDEARRITENEAGYYFGDSTTMKDTLKDPAVQDRQIIEAFFFKDFTIDADETLRINYFEVFSGCAMTMNGTLNNYMANIDGTVSIGSTATYNGETITVWGTLKNHGEVKPISNPGSVTVYKMYEDADQYATVTSDFGEPLNAKWAVDNWGDLTDFEVDSQFPSSLVPDIYVLNNPMIIGSYGSEEQPITFLKKVHFVHGFALGEGTKAYLKGNFYNEGILELCAREGNESDNTALLHLTTGSTFTNQANAGIEIRSVRDSEDPDTIYSSKLIVDGNLTNNGWINCDGEGEVRGEFIQGENSDIHGNLKYNHLYFNRLDNFASGWVESEYAEDETTLVTTPKNEEFVIFYLQEYANNEWTDTPILVSDLQSSDKFEGVIEEIDSMFIEPGQSNEDCFARISQVNWGEYPEGLGITVPLDKQYTIDVISELPEVGYYSAADVNTDNFISEFAYSPGNHEYYFGINDDTEAYMTFKALYFSCKYDSAEDKTFYYGIDGETVVYTAEGRADPSLQNDELRTLSDNFDLSSISSVEKVADKNTWKITLAENCTEDSYLAIGALFERDEDANISIETREAWIHNYPSVDYEGLFWAYCDWDNPDDPSPITDENIDRRNTFSLGRYIGAFVYRHYDEGNGTWVNDTIDYNEISVNSTSITLDSFQGNGGALPGKYSEMTLNKTGNYEFSYTNDANKTFKLNIEVNLPLCGYYSENRLSDETYLQNFNYFDSANQSFYLIFDGIEAQDITSISFRADNAPEGKAIDDLVKNNQRIENTNVWQITLKEDLNCPFDLVAEYTLNLDGRTEYGECYLNINRFDGIMWAATTVTDFNLENLSSTINIGKGESKELKLIHAFYDQDGVFQKEPINDGNKEFIEAATGLDLAFNDDTVTIAVDEDTIDGEYTIYKRTDDNGTPRDTYGVPLIVTNMGPYTITTNAGTGGTITPENFKVPYNDNKTFTIAPIAGYKIKEVKVDGVSQGAIASYEFKNVTAPHSISATFEKLTFAITTTVGANGSMTPLNPVVEYGSSQTFTITPNEGFEVDTVTVDSASKGAVTSYTFTNVTAVHTIAVTFKAKAPTVNPFTDINKNDYYYDPILWAVEEGITDGTSETTFSPDDVCTRGQVATFIWRAMGKQEPTSTVSPFTDVQDSDAYYYKAVLWAVEEGITNGTSPTTFSPNATVTRGQTVTFLWRAEDEPQIDAANPFTDIYEKDYYYNAVLWAVKEGITNGTSATTFSPHEGCKRGQIVTFLYRDLEV